MSGTMYIVLGAVMICAAIVIGSLIIIWERRQIKRLYRKYHEE